MSDAQGLSGRHIRGRAGAGEGGRRRAGVGEGGRGERGPVCGAERVRNPFWENAFRHARRHGSGHIRRRV
ncbi:MAG: hypothetical protein ACXV1K_11780, partial [Kineosporiaceae bacterium]